MTRYVPTEEAMDIGQIVYGALVIVVEYDQATYAKLFPLLEMWEDVRERESTHDAFSVAADAVVGLYEPVVVSNKGCLAIMDTDFDAMTALCESRGYIDKWVR